jgi:pimeloyl-ACP methyl ester carboxylesterase
LPSKPYHGGAVVHSFFTTMLHYRQFIKETPAEWVVFIHGAGGSSAVWHKQLKAFQAHFNLLLIDLRGHGLSSTNPMEASVAPYTFELIARDIIEVLDHVKLASAHFIGVSLGTLVIRQLGDMISDRMNSMIMVGAITQFSFQSRMWVGLGRMCQHVMPYMWLYKLFAYVIMPASNHRESRNLFIREARQLCQREFLRWFTLTGQLSSLFSRFHVHLAVPTLFVMGDQDYLFLAPLKKSIRQMQNAALLVIEECGHVVNVEKAAEFNEKVLEYLLGLKKPGIVPCNIAEL